VTEIEKLLENEYGTGNGVTGSAKSQNEEKDLAKLLSQLGSKEIEKEEKIIGIDPDDGTLILPEEPPKQKPIAKVSPIGPP